MVNIRRKAFLRKLGKPVGMIYDLDVIGDKCYTHKILKKIKKNGYKRVK